MRCVASVAVCCSGAWQHQCDVVWCSVMWCDAVCCNVLLLLQCVAVCCSGDWRHNECCFSNQCVCVCICVCVRMSVVLHRTLGRIHGALFNIHRAFFNFHRALFSIHRAFFKFYRAFCSIHRTLFSIYRARSSDPFTCVLEHWEWAAPYDSFIRDMTRSYVT